MRQHTRSTWSRESWIYARGAFFRPSSCCGPPIRPSSRAVWRSTGCSCQSAGSASHTELWGLEARGQRPGGPRRKEAQVCASRSATTRATAQAVAHALAPGWRGPPGLSWALLPTQTRKLKSGLQPRERPDTLDPWPGRNSQDGQARPPRLRKSGPHYPRRRVGLWAFADSPPWAQGPKAQPCQPLPARVCVFPSFHSLIQRVPRWIDWQD